MKSLILNISSRWIVPVMLLFSVYLLLRGHNSPGGGFIGGLTASVGLVLHAFAFGTERTQQVFKIKPFGWISWGLLLALVSGLWGVLFGNAIFEGHWLPWELPVLPALGTPLFFDIGVYLVVIGCTMLITFELIKK